ncbi:integrase [Helicobacter pylori]|uniref:Integrase XerT_2 n=1 Tax=Helicobacter pylori TaxID=210 RepID=A0A3G1LYQ0_HELPX|nr:integrase [Helicobacter pylori]AUO31542.1 integrase XerT_2 [Helicobacter pylori]
MPHNKLTKSQRELSCNLKAFLYTKAKNFTPIQDVKDMALNHPSRNPKYL